MQKIVPSLWFDNNAEEAINFYASIFKNSKKGAMVRYGDAGPGPKGTVMSATFFLEGQEFLCINGGPHYKFTPALSLYVKCEDQAEVDYYWNKFLEGGTPQQCGWITDKFGLSWQIVPHTLQTMMLDTDPAKVEKVTRAMLKMIKLDLAALKAAYES